MRCLEGRSSGIRGTPTVHFTVPMGPDIATIVRAVRFQKIRHPPLHPIGRSWAMSRAEATETSGLILRRRKSFFPS